jgi:hypothetical protein
VALVVVEAVALVVVAVGTTTTALLTIMAMVRAPSAGNNPVKAVQAA